MVRVVSCSFLRRLMQSGPHERRHFTCSTRTSQVATNTSTVPPFYPIWESMSQADSPSTSDSTPDIRVDHLVLGGGIVGLALAQSLANRHPDKTTFLVERHKRPGEETSSRNSEVIHAGLYYPPASLKTNLCLRGRELLYDYCQQKDIPHKQTGKLVVGPPHSHGYLQNIMEHVVTLSDTKGNKGALISGQRSPPPLRLITGDEARRLEPDLGPDVGWALESPRTGIVSSHELMATLEKQVLDAENAEVVYDTSVIGIRPSLPRAKGKRGADGSEEGWIVETKTEREVDSLLAKVVINAAGLNGPAALNTLRRDGYFPSGEMIGAWFSKGSYATYPRSGGGVDSVQRLIYPLPDMGSSNNKHEHQSLGTHLTLGLDGNVKFGPDTDWLRPPNTQCSDWWKQNMVALAPGPSSTARLSEEERLDEMHRSVTSFLPNLSRDGLNPDYAGIRPKLGGPGDGFRDFGVLWHRSRNLQQQAIWQEAFRDDHATTRDSIYGEVSGGLQDSSGGAMLTLCGIESPGLTSSLALAEMATDLISKRIWGERTLQKRKSMGSRTEEAGGLDSWA